MTPRRRLSSAIRKASEAATMAQRAQDELHASFNEVYGFDLCIEELNDDWTDPLVYGMGVTPSLSQFDEAVKRMLELKETPHDRL